MPNQIAGCILKNDNSEYLLVQEANPKVRGLWNLPAGYVDPGESPQQASVREVAEETGLEVELIDTNPVHEYFNESKERTYFAFLAKVVGGELQLDPQEILNAKWQNFVDIEELNDNGQIREPWIMDAIRKSEKL